ncbi:MAG TPA: acetate--CoA ligase family protein [Quisquiliibacterium sp.]|nr:acetate--CoA ligase family protein [Quisquiliibacterium sp.]
MTNPHLDIDETLAAQRAQRIRGALLRPASIALVGASDDPGKTSGRPLPYLRRAGYTGRIYPVNPRNATVMGERAWPSLASLPEVPEHAFILTTTQAACDAVAECAALGVQAATVLAAGFAETGDAGRARQAQLAEVAREAGLLLLGPSSLGIIHADAHLVLTANAAFAEPELPRGATFVASHSGSMLGALVSRGKARGIGFAGMVSVGNEADLSVGEICLATVDDPAIDSYLLFLETVRHGDWLMRFARAAARAGKPVVVYKLGRSEAGAELAQSHTGAMAGEDAVADAFLRDCGFARVETFEAVFETPALLRQLARGARPRHVPRVGVVTTTGGGAAMVVDQLGVRGIDVVPATEATHARLVAAGVDVHPGRILDLTLAGTRYEVMRATLQTMLEAPEFDAVIAVAGSSARFQPDRAVRPVIDAERDNRALGKPVIAFLAPEAPEALVHLATAGVPCFRTPEACADAIAAAFGRRDFRDAPRLPVIATHRRMLDELQAYETIARLGIRHAPAVAVALPGGGDTGAVERAGVNTSANSGASSASGTGPTAAGTAPSGVAYPVAVKVLSAAIAHKSDVGGVVLGVSGAEALASALAGIARAVRTQVPDVPVERALVQTMVAGVGEVLIGYRIDPEVGPLVMLAAGGVLAEVYRDRSLRLAPVDLAGAHAMIGEVRAMAALRGFRGRPAGDLDALAEAIVRLSGIAQRPELGVVEAEINPLIVHRAGEGVTAVDAVVWIADDERGDV